MKEKFENFKFKGETLKVIEQANSIIEEYQMQGYELTLRQLYYQFVARGLIANSQRSYSRLGDIISNARLNGDMDLFKDRMKLQEEQKELLVKCSLDWDNIAERLNEEYEK